MMENIDSWYDKVPVVYTKNLILRPFKQKDLPEVKDVYQDKSLYRFLGRNQNALERHPEYLFDQEVYDPRKENMLRWGIAKSGDDKIIGELMLYDIEGKEKCKIGCRVAKQYHSKGVATEANLGLIDYFDKKGVFPILQADVMRGHAVSCHTLEKCGFRKTDQLFLGRYYVYLYDYSTHQERKEKGWF